MRQTIAALLASLSILAFSTEVWSKATLEEQKDQANTQPPAVSKAQEDQSKSEIDSHDVKKTQKNLSVLTVNENDLTLGKKDASVVIVEYSSLSCPHCREFHMSVMPKVKADYIDSGKVLYVYRSYPTNRSALAGTKLSLCNGKEGFFKMLDTLFSTQSSWAYDEKKFMLSLENIGKLAGISNEKFDKCQRDKPLEDSILKISTEATNSLGIKAVPTFFINGEEISGDKPYPFFKALIDKKLAESVSGKI